MVDVNIHPDDGEKQLMEKLSYNSTKVWLIIIEDVGAFICHGVQNLIFRTCLQRQNRLEPNLWMAE
jgi:hypothetical protein